MYSGHSVVDDVHATVSEPSRGRYKFEQLPLILLSLVSCVQNPNDTFSLYLLSSFWPIWEDQRMSVHV